jgi:hypothetical protein
MFRTVPLSIFRSLFTVHSAMVYVIQIRRQLSSRSICPCSKAVYKPVWHIPLLSVQWINSWWWTKELSETCRVPCQNKFVNLVYLVYFIEKKFSQKCVINWRLQKVSRQNGKISLIIESSRKREFDIQIEVKELRWGVGLNRSGSGQEPVEETCIDNNEILDPLIWNISLW